MQSASVDDFNTFLEEAWESVRSHWEQVEETNPDAEVNTREESTEATFLREGFGPETGKNTDAHAEWTPVARFHVSFNNNFLGIVRGGTLLCAGNKPTCFLCASLAHALGIKVLKKDTRGYGGHYALPGFVAEDEILIRFIGIPAFKTYAAAGRPQKWLASLPGKLYERYRAKGQGKNFSTS